MPGTPGAAAPGHPAAQRPWLCYRLDDRGERAPAGLVKRLDGGRLLLVIEGGSGAGSGCTAGAPYGRDQGASAGGMAEGDVPLRGLRGPDRCSRTPGRTPPAAGRRLSRPGPASPPAPLRAYGQGIAPEQVFWKAAGSRPAGLTSPEAFWFRVLLR